MASTFPTLDITKPNSTQTGTAFAQSALDMQTFLRASLTVGGLAGYAMTVTNGTGTAEQPQYITLSKGVEQIRQTIVWGTTGGATGNPQTITYDYSSDTGATWAKMGSTNGLCTFTYDANGNCTESAWT